MPRNPVAATSLFLLLLALCLPAWAGVGVLLQYSGVVSARSTDGKVRVLSLRSAVEQGDTLYTEKDSYALIKFNDGGQLTLRPLSSISLDAYQFEPDKPEKDNAVFHLLKGGFRAITGLLGKRSRNNYRMVTPSATIGIRGTHYGGLECHGADCAGLEGVKRPPGDGLFVDVVEGAIEVKNAGGSQTLGAGQYGVVPNSQTVMQLLPVPPAGVRFTPPPGGKSVEGNGPEGAGRNKDMDCVVGH